MSIKVLVHRVHLITENETCGCHMCFSIGMFYPQWPCAQKIFSWRWRRRGVWCLQWIQLLLVMDPTLSWLGFMKSILNSSHISHHHMHFSVTNIFLTTLQGLFCFFPSTLPIFFCRIVVLILNLLIFTTIMECVF